MYYNNIMRDIQPELIPAKSGEPYSCVVIILPPHSTLLLYHTELSDALVYSDDKGEFPRMPCFCDDAVTDGKPRT